MLGRFLIFILCLISFPFFGEAAPWYTFTPGPEIAMTGSNTQVFFDVTDDIASSGSLVKAPHLVTSTETFSGAFYLSGAGWVDFSSSDRVILDCGAQSLTGLTLDCMITGTGYSEIVGDVVFSGVQFHHQTGELSGTLSTFVGDYTLSGIILPLFPAFFSEGTGSVAEHAKTLSISGIVGYFGPSDWDIFATPTADLTNVCSGAGASRLCDFSMAGDYSIEIDDPNDSKTTFTYEVSPGIPTSTTLFAGTFHQSFCTMNPLDTRCPDGASLFGMSRSETPGPIVANGTDTYDFILKIRDTYGNATSGGNVTIEYTDTVAEIQIPLSEGAPYISYGPGYAVSGSLNPLYGSFSLTVPAVAGDIRYSFSSIAPTDSSNKLVLSTVKYNGLDITNLAWTAPLVFTPWYQAALSVVGDIVVNTGVSFSGGMTPLPDLSSPSLLSAVYRIDIGNDNLSSSFRDFTSSDPVPCTKYYEALGNDECAWADYPFSDPLLSPVVLSTRAISFTGTYMPNGLNPPLESVSYKSYITYEKWGVRVLYPSTFGSLGGAQYGQSPLRILGQSNLGGQYGGITSKGRADFWNSLRKNTALLSRNRTGYTDINYLVQTGTTLTLDPAFIASEIDTEKKRSIIVIGADIVITGPIARQTHPLALIALADSAGNGGNIIIDASVKNISASLFAERGVSSDGANQLAILGSLISSNTTGGANASPAVCPYFIDIALCDQTMAKKYDLEKLRPDFDKDTSPKASGSTALANPGVATIIEYDGRILSDSPPGVGN